MKYIFIILIVLISHVTFGQSWYDAGKEARNVLTYKIYFHDPDTGFAFLGSNDLDIYGLCVTVDGGNSWKSVASYNDGRNWNRRSIMLNSKIAFYTRLENGPFEISFNQGETWDTISKPVEWTGQYVGFFNKSIIVQETKSNANDGKVFLSNDYGNTWKDLKQVGLLSLDYWSGHFNIYNDSIIYGYASDGLVKSTDTGLSWQATKFKRPIQYDYSNFKTHFIAPDTAVGYSRRSKYIYWTNNEGQSWDSIKHEIDFNSHIDDVKFADKDTGFAVVDARRLFKTCDGGKKWKEIHYFDCNQNYIGLIDAQNVYFYSTANNQGCISKTRNGGGDFCTSVATDLISETPFLHIYPQPSKGQLNIDWNPSFVPEQLLLYNANGQLLKQIKAPKQGTFQFNNLPIGVYLLKLSNSQEVRSQHVVFE